MEVTGIPTSVKDNQLEKVFCKIVDNTGITLTTTKLDACNCIGSNGRFIVKLSRKKTTMAMKIMMVTKFTSTKAYAPVTLCCGLKIRSYIIQ